MDERWNAEEILAVAAEPRRPHPLMRENEDVLTHGQCRTMRVDAGSDDDSGEEVAAPDVSRPEREPVVPDKQDEVESGARIGEPEAASSSGPARRDFRITSKLIDEFGPTPGCRACQGIREGGDNSP